MRFIIDLFFVWMLLGALPSAFAQISGLDGKPSVNYSNNLIKNPSAKSNTLYVTTSSLTVTRETSVKVDNVSSFGIQATANDGYLRFQMMTIPDGLKSGNCAFVGWFQGDASLYNAEVLDGSSNVIAAIPLTNAPNGRYFQLPVSCGTTRTPQIVQRRLGTAPKIYGGHFTYTSGKDLVQVPLKDSFTAVISSTGIVTRENENWIDGNCAVTDTSLFTCSFVSGKFASGPVCNVDLADSAVVAGQYAKLSGSASTSSVAIRTGYSDLTTAFTKQPITFNLTCTRGEDQVAYALSPAETYDSFGDIVAPTRTGGCKPGSVPANGAAVSRTAWPYSKYFAEVGTTYGAGDGSTTFNLPNVQGIGHRYVGTQTYGGATYTATLGQKRNDNLESHTHSTIASNVDSAIAYGSATKFNMAGNTWSAAAGTLSSSIGIAASGSGTETNGADIAFHGCLVLVTAQAPAISGLVISPDASTSGRSEVINTVKTISANYTATTQDETIILGSNVNVTVSLPPAALVPGKKFIIRSASSSHYILVDPNGSEGVCGQPTIRVAGLHDSITIQSATTGWIGLDGACTRTIAVNYSGAGTNGVCNSTPCTINNNYGGLVSVARTGTGVFQPNYSGIFSAAPTCNIQGGNNANFVLGFINSSLPTTTSADLRTASNGGAYIDTFGMITCTGPR